MSRNALQPPVPVCSWQINIDTAQSRIWSFASSFADVSTVPSVVPELDAAAAIGQLADHVGLKWDGELLPSAMNGSAPRFGGGGLSYDAILPELEWVLLDSGMPIARLALAWSLVVRACCRSRASRVPPSLQSARLGRCAQRTIGCMRTSARPTELWYGWSAGCTMRRKSYA